MKILIIGGTRYIGKHLCEHLLTKNHDITVFTRGNQPIPDGIKHIQGDRNQLLSFKSQLLAEKFDGVVDMLPMNEQDSLPLINIFKGNIGASVHISSQDAYLAWEIFHKGGMSSPIPLTELSARRTNRYLYKGKYPGTDTYDKVLMEEALENAHKQYAFPYTILRFPKTYGEFDGQVRFQYMVKRLLENRVQLPVIAEQLNWLWGSGYVKDMVQAIELALVNKNSNAQIYNVCNPVTLSSIQEIELIAKIMNKPVEVIPIPNKFWPKDLQSELNFYQHIVTDSQKIRTALGYKETYTLEEGFAKTIAWQIKNLKEIPEKFSYNDEDQLIQKYNSIGF
ncbi:NAD-dependent epimerase/dehydratase family protein [Dolichospermum sp. ST_sed1]|nr:NAD-dependent epimerase/dehydratase family protein [Dolichospermum sp. ST_sed1]